MSKKRSRYERRRGFVTFWPSEKTQTFTTCRDCGALVNGHEIAAHDAFHRSLACPAADLQKGRSQGN